MARTQPTGRPRACSAGTARKLLFGLMTCLLLFATVEVGWRLAFGWRRDWRDSHCWHPTLGWCLRPGWAGSEKWTGGWSRINPQGIRDDRSVGPRAPGERRLLVLGDSVTFGAMVRTEQTYTAQLEQALAGRGLRWRVLNGGVTAYDASQEAEWLDEFGWRLEPDVLVVAFCRNDVNPSRRSQHACPPPVGGLGRWLTDHLLTAYRLQRLIWSAQARLGWASATVRPGEDDSRRDGRALLERAYRRIARQARARGVPVVLLLYPSLDLLTGRAQDDLTARLQVLGRELGWPVIDLAPAFTADDPSALFLPGDPIHPSPAGFARAALFSAPALLRHLP